MALHTLVSDQRLNAVLGWGMTGIIALAAIESYLMDAFLWGCLAVLIVSIIALPSAVTGRPAAMVPWPIPFVAAVAVVLRTFEFYPDITGYVAIGTIALLLVVELDVYTRVELSRRFAVVFATMTTMSLQAFWIVAQYYSDQWLGTRFLVSQTELQWDIVYVTAVGVALGILAEWYLDRFEPVGSFERPPSG
ncbi:hypothetical protein [Haloarcula amylovorans]|uniref:hypothetical protein n=1 Tax=Haloarcula amylovorans TaxID=2562280 RepID=UPI00107697B4|nr:hypothetical protein [Halomicroarcula amylolytica]